MTSKAMTTSATLGFRFRITAENADTGKTRTLATSGSPELLVRRLAKDGALWDRLGWEAFTLEDDSMGRWTDTLIEHLRSLLTQGLIDWPTFKQLRHHAR